MGRGTQHNSRLGFAGGEYSALAALNSPLWTGTLIAAKRRSAARSVTERVKHCSAKLLLQRFYKSRQRHAESARHFDQGSQVGTMVALFVIP